MRRQKEREYMELRLKHVESFEEQLKTLRVQDAEEYNMVKIKLETDVQVWITLYLCTVENFGRKLWFEFSLIKTEIIF